MSVVGSQTQLLNVLNWLLAVNNNDTFTIVAGQTPLTFQFTQSGTITLGNVAIHYNAGDSAATLVNDIVAAINGSSLAGSLALRSAAGNSVALSGVGADPVVTVSNASALSVNGGTLNQLNNVINVYFNQDPLNVASAQNPAFYQVTNVNDGSILPADVSDLQCRQQRRRADVRQPDSSEGTFHLQIGTSTQGVIRSLVR